ncbi:MAG: hypothetical protein M3328_03855 [Chloroflexota bacterium]|nr:hypothetical protein [Chloroflexota bacterium]
MKKHNRPYVAKAISRSKFRLSPAFVLAFATFAAALLALALLASTANAAPPSAVGTFVLYQQGDPTAQTDVTNQQGTGEEDEPLNGGSTENDANSGTTSNSNSNEQNPPQNDQQGGSTDGGNAAGNTGGRDGTGNPFSWWLIVIPIVLIAIAIPFLRRRPANDPNVASPAPDLERRDQR